MVDLGAERYLNAEKNESGHTVSHNSQHKWKCKCAKEKEHIDTIASK